MKNEGFVLWYILFWDRLLEELTNFIECIWLSFVHAWAWQPDIAQILQDHSLLCLGQRVWSWIGFSQWFSQLNRLNEESRIAMRILIWEIANAITNRSQVHDKHKLASKYLFHWQYRGCPPCPQYHWYLLAGLCWSCTWLWLVMPVAISRIRILMAILTSWFSQFSRLEYWLKPARDHTP